MAKWSERLIWFSLIATSLMWGWTAFAWPPPLGYEGQQGPRVDGGEREWPFETVSVALDGLRVDGGRLADVKIGHRFKARVVEHRGAAAIEVELEITKQEKHQNVYDGRYYGEDEYEVLVRANGAPHALCGEHNKALVLPGTWADGKFTASNESFSFACIPQKRAAQNSVHLQFPNMVGGSAAAKCVDWGYKPWLGAGSLTRLDGARVVTAAGRKLPDTDAEAQALHQACVLMATADYCGQGGVNTIDNTWIDMYDDLSVKPLVKATRGILPETSRAVVPDSTTQFGFEAAWSPRGAVCLSKKRWATLPLDAFHGKCALIDPRLNPESASVCESPSEKQLEAENVLLFNYSLFTDTGLYTCADSGRGEVVTTTEVNLPERGARRDLTTPIDPRLRCDKYLGAVFRDRIAAELLLPKVQFRQLYRHATGGGFLTDDDQTTAGDVFEGYILPPDPAVQKRADVQPFVGPALNLWKRGNRYVTNTNPRSTPPAGFSFVRALGNLVQIRRTP